MIVSLSNQRVNNSTRGEVSQRAQKWEGKKAAASSTRHRASNARPFNGLAIAGRQRAVVATPFIAGTTSFISSVGAD
jgi:hypothetical protein